MTEVSISLNALAAKQQSIVGIPKGNLNQLQELVNFVTEGKVSIFFFCGTYFNETEVKTRRESRCLLYFMLFLYGDELIN